MGRRMPTRSSNGQALPRTMFEVPPSRAAVLRDFAGAWCGIRAASARSVSGEVASDRSRLAGSLLAGLICRFPDGVVVGEDHACGVKLLDAVNPGGCDGQGLGVLVAACLPGEGIGAVCAGGVVALSSDHDGAVASADDEGLVARGVSWGRHDEYAGQDLGLAVEVLVLQIWW